MYCLKCDGDCDELANFDFLGNDFVTCPHCGHKMVLDYDELYDPESGDEYPIWSFIEYEDE